METGGAGAVFGGGLIRGGLVLGGSRGLLGFDDCFVMLGGCLWFDFQFTSSHLSSVQFSSGKVR